MFRARSRSRLLTGAITMITIATATLIASPAGADSPPTSVRDGAAPGSIDTFDRDAVLNAFYDQWVPNAAVKSHWTGSTPRCDAGTDADSYQAATLAQLNFVRSLAGVSPVTFDTGLSANAQQAALLMAANSKLDHHPPQSWRCWTPAGADAAAHSNLMLMNSLADPIPLYMDDIGVPDAGHRAWLLDPTATTMGNGSTSSSNAIWVIDPSPAPDAPSPEMVAWPSAGYFPSVLEPQGLWSVHFRDPQIDTSAATVAVIADDGRFLTGHLNVAGNGDIVWQIDEDQLDVADSSRDLSYTVRITNLTRAGVPMDTVTYPVTLIRAQRPLQSVTAPRLVLPHPGSLHPGDVVKVTSGTWSPATPYSVAEQAVFMRDGKPLPAGDEEPMRHTVTSRDVGHRITAVVHKGYGDADPEQFYFGGTSSALDAGMVTALPKLHVTGHVRITGTPRLGHMLYAVAPHWGKPAPTHVTYQWFRCGIAGTPSTRRSEPMLPGYRGCQIKVKVTGTRAGYQPTSAWSISIRVTR